MKKLLITLSVFLFSFLVGCGNGTIENAQSVSIYDYTFYIPKECVEVNANDNLKSFEIKEYMGDTPDSGIVLFAFTDQRQYSMDDFEQNGDQMLEDAFGDSIDVWVTDSNRTTIAGQDAIILTLQGGGRFFYLDDGTHEIMMLALYKGGRGLDYMKDLDDCIRKAEKS